MNNANVPDDILPFCKSLPKIELHAHLTGSISRQTLHEVWEQKKAAGELEGANNLDDPLTAIPPAGDGINISTFFPLFSTYIYNLVTTASDIQYTTHSVLTAFAADNVVHLELRTTPRTTPSLTKQAYLDTVLTTIATHNASQHRLRTSLILSIDRRQTPAEAEHTVDLAIALRPRGVVGVDLCGDPNRGDVRVLRDAFARARDAGLGVTVHFGEVAAAGTEAELGELLAWEPARLGHVIHVPESVREEVRRRRLGLELCLSCNVLAGMTDGGFKGHHFGEWRGSGCPVALSTDDVGIFESELSREYALAMEHFGLRTDEVLEMCRKAASVIFAGRDETERISTLIDQFAAQQQQA